MTERVSDEVLRRWVRTLTPGQAALCEELLELRAVARAAEQIFTTSEDAGDELGKYDALEFRLNEWKKEDV